MSFENRLKRGLEAKAADMEEDVTTALKNVRAGGAKHRRMQFAGAAVAAAAIFATGALAGPSILDAMRGTDPDPGPPIGSDETPQPEPTPRSTPTTTPAPPEAPMEQLPVWFTSGELLQSSTRYVVVGDEEAQAAELLEHLFEGPNQEESELFLGTAIPAGTRLLNNYINGKQPTIDLSAEFEQPSDGDGIGQRVAQVVWTLSDLAPEGIAISVEGEPLQLEGLDVEAPYTTDEFESLLMPITVAMPYPGQELHGDAIMIAGTANVFEANVTIRVVGPNRNSLLINKKGKTIAETFTTATCGSGCRGSYETIVQVGAIAELMDAFVEVFEVSAESGEPINMVRIPVTLQPSGS